MTDRLLRILIVDDDRDTRDLYRIVLETASCEVDEAGTLADALRAATNRLPDLVLADWMLPDGDGLALGRQLRRLPALGEVPLLAITGVTMTRDELAAAHQAGFNQVLEKPVTPAAILDAIRALLGVGGPFRPSSPDH
ncbi:MAG TPA: response regulator [Vicinamibacterales bacterium]|nr:response regulator [Vicinamibacterales bacterium]